MSVELEEVHSFLASIEPFRHLPEEELVELAPTLTVRYIRRGEIILDYEESNDFLRIIRSGAIDILGPDNVLLDRRDPGLTFGYSTLLGTNSSRYRMEAVEDSLVYEMPRAAFTKLSKRNPDIARFYSSQSRRIRAAAEEITNAGANTNVLSTHIHDVKIAKPRSCPPDLSIREAAQRMEEYNVSSLLVLDRDTLLGIITDRDLRGRVVAEGIETTCPVSDVMTTKLLTLSSESLAMEALMLMSERKIHHLPVVDEGTVTGIVTQNDIARLLHNDPVFLTADLSRKNSVDELADAFTRTTKVVAQLIESGAAPEETAGMITIAADAVARRLFTLGIEKYGKPPVDFAFVAVGSQGRREMVLASDQDNALVLSDDFIHDQHNDYFQKLTEFVCLGLDRAGQVLCPGEMMAMNPQWRMTVSEWEHTFANWIGAPEPDALLNAQIFFDFRVIAGSQELGQAVHQSAVSQGTNARRMHAHLASLAARREPPLTFFKGLVVERSGEYANTLDVKKGGTAAIVQMARLYALSAGHSIVETRERLRQSAGKTVSRAGSEDLLDAFDYLRSITLKYQASQIRSGQQPNYHIDPKQLSGMERENLRDAFSIIKNMQNALATKYPVRNI
ncbi:DUF294 nucleotidyltransferase-like domain-containing protein [Corynebacterium ammoniagenes]|uniref:CBS domain protein n=1 Tax=Corynebacterium ammoniagenes DSM 20306 TaxID=649754 RepID=A0ABP2IE31_CORAM|nr:DUF294 nucleotidyltransferase-like domain-containing protein [Corynebacterium ammoniagenes]APT82838.1 histidine kinase [Corynebacterium ammoniagenes DSM 20306]AQS73887.1 histidine kinase [Corynebacterium ammoniagenes]EFG80735.1 CBS domain protein [Corynebacterium ammoniagenes DSM 20306]NMF31541.1 cyclic nucleotide-binding/CBS domain-containing protein [Corynebacterium ammoniagenes]